MRSRKGLILRDINIMGTTETAITYQILYAVLFYSCILIKYCQLSCDIAQYCSPIYYMSAYCLTPITHFLDVTKSVAKLSVF